MSAEKFCLKAGTVIVTMGMLTGFYGCAESPIVENPNFIIMATDEPVDSPIPRMTPIQNYDLETKTEASDKIEVFDSEEILDLGEIFKKAPEIEGLNKEIQDDQILYTYKEGNVYGGESGEYAGVYKDNVVYQGEKVGAVCLEQKICQKLLKDALDNILVDDSRIKIIMPVDISKYKGKFVVEKITTSDFDGYACFFDEGLNFVDICPGDNFYITSESLYDGFMVTDNDNPVFIRQNVINKNGLADSNEKYHEMSQLFYYFSQGYLDYNSDYRSSFGTPICQINSSLVIGLGVLNDNVFEATTMPSDPFLTVNGKTIVFMESPANPISFEEN